MRNLSLSSEHITTLPDSKICKTALDLDENVLYAVSESRTADSQVEIKVWKIPDTGPSTPEMLAMFITAPSSNESESDQVAELRFLPERRRLCILVRGGDIAMVPIDDADPIPEVEGTIESGILAASWSPDDELLAIVTGERKLTLMTSTFEMLSDTFLFTNELGEDAQVNVGWGSKQTQFHGSLGKAAAQAPTQKTVGTSSDDDQRTRISWRGDGAFFVVSALSTVESPIPRRALRVYDRQAVLQSTSEPVAGLEHPLSWRPSGNLIAGTQRFGSQEGLGAGNEGRHDLVFFERNGLRHGEYRIRQEDISIPVNRTDAERRRWGYKIKELNWSSDSNVLGIWIEADDRDILQLWTTGNYHWYLKHEMVAPALSAEPARFTSIAWHPEHSLEIILTTSTQIIRRTLMLETCTSSTKPPIDSGTVAVLDGAKILLTPFRAQNVPPPMSSFQLTLSNISSPARTPVHVTLGPLDETLALLWESGEIELWELQTRITPGPGKIMSPIRKFSSTAAGRQRQIVIPQWPGTVLLLGSGRQGHDLVTVVRTIEGEPLTIVEMPTSSGRLIPCTTEIDSVIWQAGGGELSKVDLLARSVGRINDASFPEFCPAAQCISGAAADSDVVIGLGSSGKLYAIPLSTGGCRVISANATSYVVASGFLIYTTSAHEAVFVPVASLSVVGDKDSESWEKRRIERGSRIVVAVPSAMGLVLQMPRGNLETINPRPLVMEVVRQDLDARNYRKAFLACRKHRIDLSVLVEHDHAAFLDNLKSFVEQVHEVDHVNLFLTSLGQSTQSPEKVSALCDSLRTELEAKDLTKYVNSILTAYIVKTPAEPEAGLTLLLRLRDTDPHLVEDAVKYIIFLMDANKLFDTALGMYDFSLVLLIAQHAQKDPREYLPFLRELRSLETHYQRFRIDDYLKRPERALRHIHLAGADRFEEAVSYIEKHRLHELAISIWKGTDQYNASCPSPFFPWLTFRQKVLEVYGDWLFERRDFRQAASIYIQGNALSKAMVAQEKGLDWQELFDLASQTGVSEEDVVAMGYRVAEDLVSKKRPAEAARVLLDYAQDTREAVIALAQGNLFSEARRIATLHDSPELLVDVIHPAALDSRTQISEELDEMKEQLRKQLNRIRELRVKKLEEPDAFYGAEDDVNLHNVDAMTDISMAPTAFTRYTVAPTTISRSSTRKTSRSRQKSERKAGRKGTVEEEEYLLKSITKLVGRFNASQVDARQLLPHLAQFTPEHVAEGVALQAELSEFEAEFAAAVDEIWTLPAKPALEAGVPELPAKPSDPLEKVPKPDSKGPDEWRMKLLVR
ncbi:polymerase II transcription elongation factor [Mycena indigotica]|uniref:Elongator complex protein 1 n=1 Tax=Mycena indigotica TaxID=2126181 RepID=A0A8H6VUY7_9AGAR|nr:polymerase II transcription elongation factor [Mycena indigotica]KAF7289209.1 polymerase II transcription elongation factor [Mycena indigotica]